MDLLQTAVVDITTLVATHHACRSSAAKAELTLPRQLRQQFRRETQRATVAYIDTLARSRRGGVDESLLRECRLAAEQQMPQAMAQQGLLEGIMGSEAGSLDGLAAARQDLWRLAHVAIHLASGLARLRNTVALADRALAESLAANLRRRMRKALVAYARAALRAKATQGRLIVKAREAALAKIGKRGTVDAQGLADIETMADPALHAVRLGVNKPLLDLRLDWQGHVAA
jgi:hypothetical protein